MRHITAMTKNMKRIIQITDDLIARPDIIERMALMWAQPGEGKTTAVKWCFSHYDGIFIRALGCSTVTSILGDLCCELGGKRLHRRINMVDFIIKELTKPGRQARPIFVDESDYLFRQLDMVDALRDIYDGSRCPVILVGMEDMGRKAQQNERLARRITEWIEFQGLDFEDTKLVTSTCCEVPEIKDDLIRHLHRETGANIGRIIIGLTRIEKFAQSNGWDSIGLEQWGERPLYFDQPRFSNKKRLQICAKN